MRIVEDTNIVFSAILNIDSNIAKLLILYSHKFEFYTCDFLKIEIAKHKDKILKITGFTDNEFYEIEFLVTKNIHFFNHLLISEEIMNETTDLIIKTDIYDVPFVALTKYLNASLWTGDKKLFKALNKNKFIKTISTEQLLINVL
ncbi:MAG: PIN domain-containing protein [Bacteroidia bacterium]